MASQKHPSSFRDPDGFLFVHEGLLYRQVNIRSRANYDALLNSGLYDALTRKGLLIPHLEADHSLARGPEAYKVLRPEPIPFISYPYEWCFSQLKDAALLTLDIQEKALAHGMSLKDCSAYNVQFRDGKPIFIDTLSFEVYVEGRPWVAYRQFCQHFLAPLALMSLRDVRLGRLLRVYTDGIPLDLASSLLPIGACLSFSLMSHILLHARAQRYFANRDVRRNERRMSRFSLRALLDSLRTAILKLKWKPGPSPWQDYYERGTYSAEALELKKKWVGQFLSKVNPRSLWDLGANIGIFSRLASERGIFTVAFDADAAAVENNYRAVVARGERNLLPLVMDLMNPSPDLGWGGAERASLLRRGPADVAMALALIHHLALANNVPLDRLADFFAQIARWAIVEFVPKEDPQAQKMMALREDVFADYDVETFEQEFVRWFDLRARAQIGDSGRMLYLFQRREPLT